MAARLSRLGKEIERLATDPGPGVSAWPVNDKMNTLEAQIEGPEDSPFMSSTYSLSIDIPDRYPFEPPRVRFLTPIYHPNIDSDGRICLDTLKMQPQGSWSPSININTVLLTIRILMGSPNADDGLVPDITEEYKRDRNLWWRKAAEHAQLNASTKNVVQSDFSKHPKATTDTDSSASSSSSSASLNAVGPASGMLLNSTPIGVTVNEAETKTGNEDSDSGSSSGSDDDSDDSSDDEDSDNESSPQLPLKKQRV